MPNEVLQARRQDLVLPIDVGFSHLSALLKVQEPKTRFRAARHQMARMDHEDLVTLVSCAFEKLKPNDRLWPHSGQLLRNRFRQLLEAIGASVSSERMLDLGFLRAGGATHLLMVTEDAELVRRRGRWMAHRTMDIYLQEVLASVYFPRLPVLVKAKVLHLALAFPATLNRMKMMTDGGLSPGMRYDFFIMPQMGRVGTQPGWKALQKQRRRE